MTAVSSCNFFRSFESLTATVHKSPSVEDRDSVTLFQGEKGDCDVDRTG